MKRILLLFLICFSTFILAYTPSRHRVRMTEPDASVDTLHIQQQLSIILAPINPVMRANLLTGLSSTMASDLIDAAKELIGSRYRRGGMGKTGFDCSGFTSYVFNKMGIELKRSSREQGTMGNEIEDVSKLLPGDLVFFGRGQNINHVGIVTSVNSEERKFEFIHSSSSFGVRIDKYPEANYWNRHFIKGRRILGTAD